MTPELIATLSDHAQGNMRALMNMAGELLALAAQREAHQKMCIRDRIISPPRACR